MKNVSNVVTALISARKTHYHLHSNTIMVANIVKELKNHLPYTFFGAFTGVTIAFFFHNVSGATSHTFFYILHPIHVFLSALATSSMYKIYSNRKGNTNIWILLVIGYLGSIGIATLSDSVIPFVGEVFLKMPNPGIHIGFIEKWWLVNPLAVAGIVLAYYIPKTQFPHAGHVLLSVWASVFHILMATPDSMSILTYAMIFIFLFLAVWLPCCLSDIVFPLLFVSNTVLSREHGNALSRNKKKNIINT